MYMKQYYIVMWSTFEYQIFFTEFTKNSHCINFVLKIYFNKLYYNDEICISL